jgi:predicted Zn-dependent peptidase|tara:strand:- start:475 stop:684 length:210 start_codon:yes stop_codon:yes gene_type:complete
MKEITLRVPDQKVDFVLQLVEQLGLETTSEFQEITEEHKAIVRERIRLSNDNPERLLDWEEDKDSFKFD